MSSSSGTNLPVCVVLSKILAFKKEAILSLFSAAKKSYLGCHTLQASHFLRTKNSWSFIAKKGTEFNWHIVGSNQSAILVDNNLQAKASFESKIFSYFWSKMWVQIHIRAHSWRELNQIFPKKEFDQIKSTLYSILGQRYANTFGKKLLRVLVKHDYSMVIHGRNISHHFNKIHKAKTCLHPPENEKLNIILKSTSEKQKDFLFGELIFRLSRNCTRKKGYLDLWFWKRPVPTLRIKIHSSMFLSEIAMPISIGLQSMYIITADFVVLSNKDSTNATLHYVWEEYRKDHPNIFMSSFFVMKSIFTWKEAAQFCGRNFWQLPTIYSAKDEDKLQAFLNKQLHKVMVFKTHVVGTALIFIGLGHKVSLFLWVLFNARTEK